MQAIYEYNSGVFLELLLDELKDFKLYRYNCEVMRKIKIRIKEFSVFFKYCQNYKKADSELD